MSCNHYEQGACRLTASNSVKTVWVGAWPVVKTVVETLPCPYSSDVWIGGQCYGGRVLEGQLQQKDCPLYRAPEAVPASVTNPSLAE